MVKQMNHQIAGVRAISRGYRAPQPTADGLLVGLVIGKTLEQGAQNQSPARVICEQVLQSEASSFQHELVMIYLATPDGLCVTWNVSHRSRCQSHD